MSAVASVLYGTAVSMVSVLFVKFIEAVTAELKVTPTPIQFKIKPNSLYYIFVFNHFAAILFFFEILI